MVRESLTSLCILMNSPKQIETITIRDHLLLRYLDYKISQREIIQTDKKYESVIFLMRNPE